MAKSRNPADQLKEALARIAKAGIRPAVNLAEEDRLPELNDRIRQILQIIKSGPQKAIDMTCLIMYDISEDKVRYQIARYLIKQGCIRIQKSVFLVRTKNKAFQEIYDTLKEVNEYYTNQDSIILVPINASDVRAMKLIGQNVDIQAIIDKPNTLFF